MSGKVRPEGLRLVPFFWLGGGQPFPGTFPAVDHREGAHALWVVLLGTHYLWVARLDDGAKLKVTDPKEQQGDVEEEEAKGKERRDCIEQGAGC